MRSTRTRVVRVFATLASLLIGASFALADQTPTLGELALKEQERRKALKAAGRVLTKAELPPGAAPAADAQGSVAKTESAAKGQSAAKTESAPSTGIDKDEAWWRQCLIQARDELRRNEIFTEALQARINALTNDFASRDDPYQRARIGDDRHKAIAELGRVKSDVELQRKKVAEIEEDARRAGVPPGWLR